jgi:2-iminobutanoate/2-iminopropanoate deaminase
MLRSPTDRSQGREEERDMTRDARRPEGVAEPRFPYSPVVVAGDLVFTAGQVAHDGSGSLVDGGIEEQTRRVLGNVERCLAAAGCSMDDVVKVTAFLSDLGDFEGYNRAYAERFGSPYPARTTVGARLPDGILVEVEAVARRGG